MTFASSQFGLKIADWKFSEDRLREFAILSAEIRAAINEKARLYKQVDEVPLDDLQPSTYMKGLQDGRKGMKYSTAANNPEGMLEKEIKARE